MTGPILDDVPAAWLLALPAIANATVEIAVLVVLPRTHRPPRPGLPVRGWAARRQSAVVAGDGFGISFSALYAVDVAAVAAKMNRPCDRVNANVHTGIGGALEAAVVASDLATYGSAGRVAHQRGFPTAFGVLAAAELLILVSHPLIPELARKELA